MTQTASVTMVERLRGRLSKATARPWRAFDRNGVLAVMKGNEPPLKDNGYHSRRWPEIIAWSGFDGAHVPKRYRSENLHLIVDAVNALPVLLDALETAEKALEITATQLENCAEMLRSRDVEPLETLAAAKIGRAALEKMRSGR